MNESLFVPLLFHWCQTRQPRHKLKPKSHDWKKNNYMVECKVLPEIWRDKKIGSRPFGNRWQKTQPNLTTNLYGHSGFPKNQTTDLTSNWNQWFYITPRHIKFVFYKWEWISVRWLFPFSDQTAFSGMPKLILTRREKRALARRRKSTSSNVNLGGRKTMEAKY